MKIRASPHAVQWPPGCCRKDPRSFDSAMPFRQPVLAGKRIAFWEEDHRAYQQSSYMRAFKGLTTGFHMASEHAGLQ